MSAPSSTWKRPSWRPAIVCAALFVAYKLVYLGLGYFEWYSVPPLALIFILAAAGLDRITKPVPALAIAGATVLALMYAIHLPFTLPLEARVQHNIEDRVRQPLGRYLGRVSHPPQTIATESSGYVGYDTNAPLEDFPGLVSTKVVDALRAAGPSYYTVPGIAALLHSDWLVLRPGELEFLRDAYPKTAKQYRVVRRFSVSDADSSLDRWGLNIANADRTFIVLRRKPAR